MCLILHNDEVHHHVIFVSGVDVSCWVKVFAAPITNGTDGALAWIGMPIFDGVIFFLTLYKAFTLGKGVRLLDMIVRDGAPTDYPAHKA
jgi:hypothetical protein